MKLYQSTKLQCVLATMITLLVWINCRSVIADLDESRAGSSIYIFNTNAPNPYTQFKNVYGGPPNYTIIYESGAEHYVTTSNMALYIGSGNANIEVQTNAIVTNDYNGPDAAIYLGATATIENAGTIQTLQGINRGAAIQSYSTLTVNNAATGQIINTNHNAIYGANVVNNHGTITAKETQYAIYGTTGDDTVTLYTGSSTTGIISGVSYTDNDHLILDNGADANVNGHLASSVEGFEKLTKQGTAQWTVDQNNSVSANTLDIASGTLAVNGHIYNMHTQGTIRNGATLSGTGQITGSANLTVNSGGSIAPGNSIGTLILSTPVVFEAGSNLNIEVDTTGYDKLLLNSDIDLANATLNIIPLVENVTADEHVILETTGLVNNTFTDVNVALINTAVISFIPRYYTDYVTLQADIAQFEEKARTPNQRRVGLFLDNLPASMNDLRDAMRGIGDEDDLRREMDRLTPNSAPIHTVFTNAQNFSQSSVQVARTVTSGNTTMATAPGQSILKQLTDDPYSLAQDAQQPAQQSDTTDNKYRFFASPFGQFGNIDDSSSRIGYNFEAYGAIFGLDYQCLPNTTLGLSLGYINTDIGMNQSAGDSNIDTLRFGPYATYTNGPWNIDASLTGGIHWVDANRNTIMGTAESDYNSYDITVYGAASYDKQIGQVTVTPTMALTYIHQMTDSYSESGAGTANLNVDDVDSDSLQSLIGVHASMPIMLGNMQLTPEAWIGWQYEWLDRDIDINSSYAANPTSSLASTTDGTARSQLVAGAAVFTKLDDDLTLKMNYELNKSNDATIHSVWAMIELAF
ncbi:MAG TPA: hypothetical protein DER01_14650 [Phycisphaerales bacterium]|nr:hypothetical protein [Phycisphaerales bacterium]